MNLPRVGENWPTHKGRARHRRRRNPTRPVEGTKWTTPTYPAVPSWTAGMSATGRPQPGTDAHNTERTT